MLVSEDDDNVYLMDDPEDDVWSWLWPYLNTTQVSEGGREGVGQEDGVSSELIS